jgi:phosphate/sulfate permease
MMLMNVCVCFFSPVNGLVMMAGVQLLPPKITTDNWMNEYTAAKMLADSIRPNVACKLPNSSFVLGIPSLSLSLRAHVKKMLAILLIFFFFFMATSVLEKNPEMSRQNDASIQSRQTLVTLVRRIAALSESLAKSSDDLANSKGPLMYVPNLVHGSHLAYRNSRVYKKSSFFEIFFPLQNGR